MEILSQQHISSAQVNASLLMEHFCYEPVSLEMPVTSHGRSQGKFLLNHTDCALTHPYISIWSSCRPVHSQICQSTRRGEHSSHRYFIESRPMSSISHLWDTFVNLLADSYGYGQPLSRSFIPQSLRLTHVRQDETFRGVTLSFHLLKLSVYR